MSFSCLFHISISALNCASRNAIRVYDRLLCLLPSIYGKCTTRSVLWVWVCCCFIFPLQAQRSNLGFQIKAVFSVWYDCLLVRMLSAIKALTKVNEVRSLTHILRTVQGITCCTCMHSRVICSVTSIRQQKTGCLVPYHLQVFC